MITSCPFCFSTQNVSTVFENTYFNGKIFEYRKCLECKLIYVQPFPSHDDYVAMYPTTYQGEINLDTLYRNENSKIIKLINQYSNKKKLLDYGCGNGSFILQAQENKFECTGVEFSNELIISLSKQFNNVNFQNIIEFENKNEKFDIIHISNVLEHLINPFEVIQNLKRRLNDDGIFIISGPIENNLSLALVFRKLFFGVRKYFLNKNNNHAPFHIFYSNSTNQSLFFTKSELSELYFEVKEIAWPFPSNLRDSKGLAKKLMYFIAKLSIFFSLFNKKLGNNFIYVGCKKKS
ncbi:MAG: hypothetical protein A2046_14255 [Bacteroidetes bacterium GWA2_30_7]|nr:MAG: hypothetical protein A2046_14255 [Bacteroidetes bacterium GWA2_30_7]